MYNEALTHVRITGGGSSALSIILDFPKARHYVLILCLVIDELIIHPWNEVP